MTATCFFPTEFGLTVRLASPLHPARWVALTGRAPDLEEDGDATSTASTFTLTELGSYFEQLDLDDFLPSAARFVWPAIFALTNDLHPIFAEHQWHGLRLEVLSPALQLASQLLDSPASMQ